MSFDAETLRAFERACSADNRQCVASKQYFDDWVRALPAMVRSHTDLQVRVAHLPGMPMGSAYAVKVAFEGAQLGAPVSINKAGDVDNLLTPTRARLENLTYAAPLYVSLRVETQAPAPNGGAVYKGSAAENVFLGTVPVMVGASVCSTRRGGETGEEIDAGGYFIVKGNEKIIPWFRATDVHSTVCYEGSEGEVFATVRSGVSHGKIQSTRLVKPPDALPYLKFKGAARLGQEVTPGVLLAALGVPDPVGAVFGRLERVDAAFYGEAAFDPRAGGAAGVSAEDADGDAVMGEAGEDALLLGDAEGVFPGTAAGRRAEALVSFLRVARYMRETGHETDRDSIQSQQLDGVREILAEVFHKTMRATVKQMRQKLQSRLHKLHTLRHDRKRHRASTLEMPTADWVAGLLTKTNSVSPGLHYFCATGNLQGGGGGGRGGSNRTRSGCCQILERTSFLQAQSCMHKVVTPLDAQAAPTAARRFRLDSLGFLCPAATPEGKRTGLIGQKAVGASVSRDRFACVPALEDVLRHFLDPSPADYGARSAGVWVSGRFHGTTETPRALVAALRGARRSGQLPRDMGVSTHGDVAVCIRVHAGRMLKPLVPMHRAQASPRAAHTPQSLRQSTWSHLIHTGVVETLDAREEGGAYVCPAKGTPGPRHTHKELFETAALGCCAATIPFLDHEPSPRASYYTSQAQQAMGFDMRNFANRMDTKSYGLWYPQRALVSTSYERASGAERRAPVGVNVVVAIMSLQGCEEDAILVSQGAVDRGLFRGTQWDVKTVTTADRTQRVFASPASTPTDAYDPAVGALDFHTGLAKVGAVLETGDPYCALASAQGVRTLKHGGALPAEVQRVVVFDNAEGFRTAKLKLRTDRPLAVGDKLSSRFAQKGVVSRLIPEADLPWLEDGGRLDMIVNPCFL